VNIATEQMTNAEYGAWLADKEPPLRPEVIDQAARIIASWRAEQNLRRSA